MNSKNCSELKILTVTLIETYGQKENENNWNDSALAIRKLSNLISSYTEKLEPPLTEDVKLIINVLEKSVLLLFKILFLFFSASVNELDSF